ncbi:MAG: hypothetical protein ACYSX0_16995 [Planctomycetota bacterium]|jgi:hypothetical protein
MTLVMHPVVFLLISVACVVAAVAYFHQHLHFGVEAQHVAVEAQGVGGLACGFLVMGGAALLGAVYLHKKP